MATEHLPRLFGATSGRVDAEDLVPLEAAGAPEVSADPSIGTFCLNQRFRKSAQPFEVDTANLTAHNRGLELNTLLKERWPVAQNHPGHYRRSPMIDPISVRL